MAPVGARAQIPTSFDGRILVVDHTSRSGVVVVEQSAMRFSWVGHTGSSPESFQAKPVGESGERAGCAVRLTRWVGGDVTWSLEGRSSPGEPRHGAAEDQSQTMTAHDCVLSARLEDKVRSGRSPGASAYQLGSRSEHIADAPKAGRFLFHFESWSPAPSIGRIDHFVVVDVGRRWDAVTFAWFVDQGSVERRSKAGRARFTRRTPADWIWQIGRPRAVSLIRVDEALGFPLVPVAHPSIHAARPE